MRIRRGLSSRYLWCGCLVGINETNGGDIVGVVDVRGRACRDPEHAPNRVVHLPDAANPGNDRLSYNGILDGCQPKT